MQQQTPQICPHKSPTKICLSPDCKIPTPLICQQCEQQHEHNGTISAVRVSKVKEIVDGLRKRVEATRQTVEEFREFRKNVVEAVGGLEVVEQVGQGQEQGQGEGEVERVAEMLSRFVEGKGEGEGSFADIWDQAKKINKPQQANPQPQTTIPMLKKKLLSLITPNTQQPQQAQCSQIPQNITQSEFLHKFAHLFSYLSVTLKSAPSQYLLLQIANLSSLACTKQTTKILCKMHELVNQPEKSLSLYTELLTKSPLDVECLARKAFLLKKTHHYQEAYDEFCLLMDLLKGKESVDLGIYSYYKAEVCAKIGKYDEGLRELERVGGAVRQWKVDRCMAEIKQKQGKLEQAISLYTKSVSSPQPTHPQKSTLYQHLLSLSQSLPTPTPTLTLACLSNLISLNPTNLQHIFKRARFHHQHKNYTKSIQDYTLAIQQVKDIPGAYYNRAVQYIYAGLPLDAIADLKKAIQLQPDFKEAVHLLAGTCFQIVAKKGVVGEVEGHLRTLAVNSYGYSLNFYPNNQGIWHNLGILQSQKNPQKAYQCFSKALQINPKLASSYLGRAKVSIMLKKNPAETIKDVRMLIGLGDRTVSTFLLKCILEEQMGEYQQMLDTANLILKADPQNVDVLKARERALEKVNIKQEQQEKQEEKKQEQEQEKQQQQEKQEKRQVKQQQSSNGIVQTQQPSQSEAESEQSKIEVQAENPQ